MIRYLAGAFLILHGLVHLLYFGQSWRMFELQPGMVWPDGSWALSRLLGDNPTRLFASVFLVVAALGFIVAGAAILFAQGWWRPVVIGTLVLSSVLYIALWNGRMQSLDNQGGVALLINIASLLAVLVFRWPKLAF
jgi:hypothetical protein